MATRLRIAVVVMSCALLGAAMIGGTADAKKKGKGKKSSTITLTGKGAPIPDAKVPADTDGDGYPNYTSNGEDRTDGVLTSTIRVPEKKEAKIKDLDVQVAATGTDVGDYYYYLVGPRGGYVRLSLGNDNYLPSVVFPSGDPFESLGVFGPVTFDDQAAVAIDDYNSCPNLVTEDDSCTPPNPDGGGVEAFAPYTGAYRPQDGTLASLGSKLEGVFTLIILDPDAPNECNPPACSQVDAADTGSLTSWKLIVKPKGGGGGKKKK